MAKKAKRAYRRKAQAKSRALAPITGASAVLSPKTAIERIEGVTPAAEDVVQGVVQSIEILPDGSKRVTYASVKAFTKNADGSVRWDYFRPDEV